MINEFTSRIILFVDSTVCDPSNISSKVCNPLNKLGVNDVPSLLVKFLNDFGGIIGLLAIAMLVYAGLRMVTANGDKKVIDQSKRTVTYSILGILAAVFAYAGIAAIENFIGVQDVNYDSDQLQNPLGNYADLKDFTQKMIVQVLMVIGLVSLAMIIWNGFMYLTSRGDKTKIDNAKRGLTWSILGLILALFAYTIIKAVATFIS